MRARIGVGLMAFSVTLLTVATLFAQPPPASGSRDWLRQTAQRAGSAPVPSQLSTGKWAALVLLVGFAGFAVWKRKRVRQAQPAVVPSRIQITSVTKLSPKAQLMVATVNGRSMLLGVTDATVTRITWLDGADDEDEDAEDDEQSVGKRVSARENQATRGEGDIYPNRFAASRSADAEPRKALPVLAKGTKSRKQPSRFREVLADAIGLGSNVTSPARLAKAPVDELVAATSDRYVGGDTRTAARQAPRGVANGPLIDVEGQAAGLVARLNRPGT